MAGAVEPLHTRLLVGQYREHKVSFSPRAASLWLGDDKTAAKDAWMVLALLCGCPRTNFVALALANVDHSISCSARLKETIGNWCLLVSRNGSAPFRKQRPMTFG